MKVPSLVFNSKEYLSGVLDPKDVYASHPMSWFILSCLTVVEREGHRTMRKKRLLPDSRVYFLEAVSFVEC